MAQTAKLPDAPPARIRIGAVTPTVDCGAYPARRCQGDVVEVGAAIICDGHEQMRAAVQYRSPGRRKWEEAPMRPVDAHLGGVRWQGEFAVDALGPWEYRVVAWVDPVASWLDELKRKLEADQDDLTGELSEGLRLIRDAAKRARGEDRRALTAAAAAVETGADPSSLLGPAVAASLDGHVARTDEALSTEHVVAVDPVRARFGSWYELFPRSWGGFAGVREHLPQFAELGIDVLYLSPIHPIGVTHRKGRGNALVAAPDDPGSPWAIGGDAGGHTAIHPDLGTSDDFDALVADAGALGIDIALDLALQCSPDHPWLREHPEWFHRRPDGTLKYAENPPKRYQDIYNLNFDSPDWKRLWRAILKVVRYWVDRGVRVFRVDNPHTKPIAFWEWLIAVVRASDPEVVFLAEAFTRRAVMQELAKAGFQQSYTYFTWKTTRWEITEYVSELASVPEREFFRPNFFVNTSDILTAELQQGGPPAFALRAVLAATLSPSWGLYSGFESFEGEPAEPGSEEYLDSEKYALRTRSLDGPLLPLIGLLNGIRRVNPALQQLGNVRFLDTRNDALIAYAREWGRNLIVVVVNLDPRAVHEGLVRIPDDLLPGTGLAVTDLLDGTEYLWQVGDNYVRLDPGEAPAHVFAVNGP
ncbi:MAG: maltotransferase domain-containing protein [Miltoncostaeaceae bacterium]